MSVRILCLMLKINQYTDLKKIYYENNSPNVVTERYSNSVHQGKNMFFFMFARVQKIYLLNLKLPVYKNLNHTLSTFSDLMSLKTR